MALTATANEQTTRDIISKLGMQSCVMLKQSFNRPNLFYEVREKKGKGLIADMFDWIQTNHAGKSGVIYCLSRNKCEEVAKDLREKHGLRAKHYHAAMSTADKAKTQQEWQDGKCEIIVATVRFIIPIDIKIGIKAKSRLTGCFWDGHRQSKCPLRNSSICPNVFERVLSRNRPCWSRWETRGLFVV